MIERKNFKHFGLRLAAHQRSAVERTDRAPRRARTATTTVSKLQHYSLAFPLWRLVKSGKQRKEKRVFIYKVSTDLLFQILDTRILETIDLFMILNT